MKWYHYLGLGLGAYWLWKNPYAHIPANVPSNINPVMTERVEAKVIDSGLNPETFGTENQWIDPTALYETPQGTASWTLSEAFRTADARAASRPVIGWEDFKNTYKDTTLFWLLGRDLGITNLINLFEYPVKSSDLSDANQRIPETSKDYIKAISEAPEMANVLRSFGVTL